MNRRAFLALAATAPVQATPTGSRYSIDLVFAQCQRFSRPIVVLETCSVGSTAGSTAEILARLLEHSERP